MIKKQLHFRLPAHRIKEGSSSRTFASVGQEQPESDAEIWQAFKDGDTQALEYIYSEYVNKMYNYGCQLTTHEALVSDCIQALFTEMIRKRQQLGDTSSIKFYLFKALRRKLMRALKRELKQVSFSDLVRSEGFNVQNDTEAKFIQQEFSDQQKSIIANECNKLPAKQKEALLLYFYEGLSYQEIAETLGMTRTKSARALIYRAIHSLSNQLQHYKEVLYPFWPLLLASQLL
ncbi:MAG: sigma-70 family RNA polymerase sigma factor [Cyclobacteriaceae bacterium]